MKYLFLLITFLFIGCTSNENYSRPVSYCKQQGYKGIANYKNQIENYCSNGEIIGGYMLTSDGEKELELTGSGSPIKLIYTEFK